MAVPVIYFAGLEDVDYNITGNTGWTQGGGLFRGGFARGGVQPGNIGGSGSAFNINPWNGGAGASAWWFSVWMTTNNTGNTNGQNLILWYDTAGIIRFFIQCTGNNTANFFKRTAAGASTLLGSMNFAMTVNVLYKLDVHLVDGVSGSVTVYITPINSNTTTIMSFAGDTTTDSSTHNIITHQLFDGLQGQIAYTFSELIVSDSDTRSMSCVTLAPAANGNTHNFDIGSPAASNVNEWIINDATLDGASTAGLIDQYTINGLPGGTFSILDVRITARMEKGYSGPTKMDLGVRSNSIDSWSSDFVLTNNWVSYFYDLGGTDPGTGNPWLALPTNIGLRAAA